MKTMASDWLRYANQGAIRSRPLDEQLVNALGFLPELGLTMEVFSGGQAPKGSGGPRTGSTRHDHGNAADAFFYKDGRQLDWANPQDRPVFEEIVRRGRSSGLTGFGAGPGYMRPGSMHLGFGKPGVWGAGGSGANAPNWLRAAFEGSKAGAAPTAIASAFVPGAPAAAPGPGQPQMPMAPGGMPPGWPFMQGQIPGGDPLSQLAMAFMQNQQQTRERQREEEENERARKLALFAPLSG